MLIYLKLKRFAINRCAARTIHVSILNSEPKDTNVNVAIKVYSMEKLALVRIVCFFRCISMLLFHLFNMLVFVAKDFCTATVNLSSSILPCSQALQTCTTGSDRYTCSCLNGLSSETNNCLGK
jgi:hypothetical protein